MVKIMLDTTQYTTKPQGAEIGKIQNSLKPVSITIPKLAQYLVAGCSFKPAFLNGKKEKDWISQQVFCLDFDNNTTIQKELNRCRELNILPAFGYTSFSHTPEHHKFRLVFVANKIITDYNTAKQVQKTLMQIFNNADVQCSNLSRLYFGGKELIYSNYNNTVNYEELLNKYGTKQPKKANKAIKPSNNNINKDQISEHIEAIRRLDVKRLKLLICKNLKQKYPSNIDISRVRGTLEKSDYNNKEYIYLNYCSHKNPIGLKASCRADLRRIITQKIDMSDFLGVPSGQMFNCVLHSDTNPSAHIIVLEDNTQVYKCFGCGFTGTIIKVVEKIAQCNKMEAIKFIQNIYDIELMETEKQKYIKELLQENIDYVLSPEFEIEYPEIYKIIKRYIPELVCLHEIAKQNVIDDDLIMNNKAIFFASIRYIANYLNKSNNLKRISQRVNLFAFLGLIEKISKENIPDKYLKNAEKYKKDKYITSYYAIPSYCCDIMENVNKNATVYKQKNMTMTGFSRELLIRSLSKQDADKIYVQQTDQKLSQASNNFANKATKIIMDLIDKQGYCTEEQIIKRIRGKKSEKKTRLKKVLQEILENYNLKRIRCNKQLKQKYGITSKGYPFLIVKNQ